MNAHSRRRVEMGTRALEFSRAHPDSEPGTETVVARLEQLVARANNAAAAQRDGFIQVRAARSRKEDLRRQMLEVAIRHLAEVGRAAAREEHELGKAFRFRPEAFSYFAFRTAARGMLTAALASREVLLKYGLSPSVLEEFVRQLDEFDEAVVLGYEGRAARTGATREFGAVANEIFRTVRLMDGRNRQRFANDGQLLGSWISASTVFRAPRPGTEPEGETPGSGEARPAA
jgi:hypothetical protein